MEKIIWVLGEKRADVLDIQRKINSLGSMRTLCILSYDALRKTINERLSEEKVSLSLPSVILVDYELVEKETELLNELQGNHKIAGVPLIFFIDNDDKEEECYLKGAMIVLRKPLTHSDVIRIERAAWQYEITKKYEGILQKQASDLQVAKEIQRLNEQLESRNEFLYRIFGKYFSDDVLEVILDKPEGSLIGGDRRNTAILMADIRGFSSVSEEMSAESITDLLNRFFGNMVEIISHYGGTVIEYMGDGVLAVFGAPLQSEDYLESAVAAGIDMQNKMMEVNQYCNEIGCEELEMGIGIHCGEVFVGNVGTENMMRYNVLGRTVNECSRIEGYSVGGQVLVSEKMINQLSCNVQVQDTFVVSPKGMKEPMAICKVTAIGGRYNCCLKEEDIDTGEYSKNEDVVEMYLINNKFIEEIPQRVILKRTSFKTAMLKVIETDGMKVRMPEVYSDIELRSINSGEDVFSDVYAKVLAVVDENIEIHFTHINGDFKEYIQKVSRECLEEEQKMCIEDATKIKLIKSSALEVKDILADIKTNYEGCTLTYITEGNDIRLLFVSDDRQIRALEFMDFLIADYGMAKGDASFAEAVISGTLLKMMMNESDVDEIEKFLEKKIVFYYNECEWLYSAEFVEKHKEEILNRTKYVKKKVSWAYVKTTDILPEGEKFTLRSLENESDMVKVSSKDLYIMIGCRGEIYCIDSDKFHKTYEVTEEKLDIFESMLEFLPEVKSYSGNEYISLDDKAKMCYPKTSGGIYAKELKVRTKVFTPYNGGEYFVGRNGDYLAIREDDLLDMYIIQHEIFGQTYMEIEKE